MGNSIGQILALLTRIADAVDRADVRAEGLDAASAAMFIGVSVSKFHQLVADGHAPAPVELGIGRCPRWMRSELAAWLKAGAPTRGTWARMRELRRTG